MIYKYHFKGLLAILILLCFEVKTLAQNGQNEITSFGTNIIPPSPDAAALGKYGNTPVGLHTGIPQINIPIYTIRSKSLEVPISLSYHASGIKVNEIASWAGLGWSLNAGGAISRSVVGLSDDNGGFWTQSVKNSSQITTADLDYVRGVANGQIDGESDYYFYNFNGNSGKFVYKQNSPQDPLIIPEVPIKITYTSENRFEITDERGVLYKFAATETMTSASGGVEQTFLSSFYLSEIISADGSDKIQFVYESDGTYSESMASFSETIGPECNENNTTSPSHSKSNGSSTRTYYPQRLKEIIFSNGKVEFVKSSPRLDASTSRLSEIKVFGKNPDGSFSSAPIKSFMFGAAYFESGTGTSELDYRLKLNSLAEKDAQGKVVKSHSFFYNETTSLPIRTSLARDWWGYHNGKTDNQSLIPTETLNYSNSNYTIGSGSREPDGNAMQACMLNKIVYPTGGYTELDYEPHNYAGTTKTQHNIGASSGELGNTTDLLQQTVSFTPTTSGWATVKTSCSDVTDPEPFYSRVILRRQSDSQILLNHIYDPYSYSPFEPKLDKDFGVYLTGGVTYELQVMSKGNSSSTSLSGAAFSMATVYWDELTSGIQKIAGGLRVTEIRDYEGVGKSPIKKIYKYGIGENGNGYLLIPEYGLNSSKQEIDIEFWWKDPANELATCEVVCRSTKLTISGLPALELSSLNGAPVVYPEVTIYESSTTAPNGKQVAKFDVQEDEFFGTHKSYNNGRFQLNDSWKGGDQIWSAAYEGNNNTVVQESTSRYAILKNTNATGTRIIPKVSFSGNCTPPYPSTSDYYYFDYPIYSGIKRLTANSEIKYSSTDELKSIHSQVGYEYNKLNNQHQQLTKQTTVNSVGEIMETKYWYPADYDPVSTIPALLQKNIIAIPIKTESHINGKIISGIVKQLDSNGKPIEMYSYESTEPQTPPAHQTNTIVPPGYVKKINITYDPSTKNIKNVQMSDNISSTYLWGYNNSLPIAEIKNAQNTLAIDPAKPTTSTKDVVIKSTSTNTDLYTIDFTTHRSGDGEIKLNFNTVPGSNDTGTIICSISGPNGFSQDNIKVCISSSSSGCAIPSSVAISLLDPGDYILTAKLESNLNINTDIRLILNYPTAGLSGVKEFFLENFEESGVEGQAHTGTKFWNGDYTVEFKLPNNRAYVLSYCYRDLGVWRLQEEPYTGPGKILTKGDAIDDVRIHPKDALVTTYTYEPLIGITSSTDPAGTSTYFEYDEFGRLKHIKDQDKNILQKSEYQYVNQ